MYQTSQESPASISGRGSTYKEIQYKYTSQAHDGDNRFQGAPCADRLFDCQAEEFFEQPETGIIRRAENERARTSSQDHQFRIGTGDGAARRCNTTSGQSGYRSRTAGRTDKNII